MLDQVQFFLGVPLTFCHCGGCEMQFEPLLQIQARKRRHAIQFPLTSPFPNHRCCIPLLKLQFAFFFSPCRTTTTEGRCRAKISTTPSTHRPPLQSLKVGASLRNFGDRNVQRSQNHQDHIRESTASFIAISSSSLTQTHKMNLTDTSRANFMVETREFKERPKPICKVLTISPTWAKTTFLQLEKYRTHTVLQAHSDTVRVDVR